MSKVTAEMSVEEVLRIRPHARELFDRDGLKGCGGEHGPAEPLSSFASVHRYIWSICSTNSTVGLQSAHFLYLSGRPGGRNLSPLVKAAIVTALSVGCMWDGINLLQIA